MDDDFPTDQPQPHSIRDRATSRAQRRRRAEPRSEPARGKADEPESVKPARALLEQILEKMGLTHVEVSYLPRSEGEYFEITGPDLATLIGRHGNTLEALNLVFNNILNAGVRSNRKYFTIDAEGYRARRADQLKNIALVSLERCIREKKPQALDPMLPSERKIIHLALAESPYVRTESEGVEPERRVIVHPR
ncbi:MAG: protein jag [Candidatus Eremiobacteraeota bacterium]|nr:protein jag [Candidatus Eremiobacteraeota bacterium]